MKKLLLALLAVPMLLVGERLTVNNETDQHLYVSVYYVPFCGKVNKASEVLSLPAKSHASLCRPAQRIGSDHRLLILPHLNFPCTFTTSTFKAAGPNINLANGQNKKFYIGTQQGQLRGYNEGEWHQRGKSRVITSSFKKN